jgi:hypothetical protein
MSPNDRATMVFLSAFITCFVSDAYQSQVICNFLSSQKGQFVDFTARDRA